MPASLFSSEDPPSGLFVRVAIERGLDHPEGLTYALPLRLRELRVGERVRVPLGRGDRPAEGYITDVFADPGQALPPGLDPARVKLVLDRAASARARASGGGPASAPLRLPEPLLRLAMWMSRYYCAPLGLVAGGMMPAAVKHGVSARTPPRLALASGALSGPSDRLAALSRTDLARVEQLGALPEGTLPAPPRAIASALSLKTTAPITRLVRAGVLEPVESAPILGESGAGQGPTPAGAPTRAPVLTADQNAAVGAITASLGRFEAFVLLGVTGSGKTEVYLGALERALARGQCGIVLVPEISLTPQTAARFIGRFGAERVAVLHSGLSSGERRRQWDRVARGAARVVVGARSAVFAPFDPDAGASVGLIVVDEEHDGSYKQDQLPRYHARDVALKRGQLESCPVMLGSATPSLESWHNAMPASGAEAGRFKLLRLPERVGGGALPRVEIVDLAQERRRGAEPQAPRAAPAFGNAPGPAPRAAPLRALGPHLALELQRTLEGPGQAILLLNRRGYASYLCCADPSCGWFMTCKHCDATVVYHRSSAGPNEPGGADDHAAPKARGTVRCHHCLSEQRLPALCPVCAGKIVRLGFGTQRLEDELIERFPALLGGRALLRLDSDTMHRARDYFHALDRFATGEIRLLVGTQMLAKGLDFPGVELIGVVNADTALSLPDFRAAERTFQLVSQVAGRAGRSEATRTSARVIVQTASPDEPAIRLAAAHDYETFARQELELRRDAGLPPVTRMVRIVCRDEDHAQVTARAQRVYLAAAEHARAQQVVVRPPAPCAISRIGGFHRVGIELLAPSPGPLQRVLAGLRSAGLVRSDAHTAVDVDPVDLL